MLFDITVEILFKLFNTFHKYAIALRQYILQHRQSSAKSDYKDLDQICIILQQLASDSLVETESQKALVMNQKVQDFFEMNTKPQQKTITNLKKPKLNLYINILKYLLHNTSDELQVLTVSDSFKAVQTYYQNNNQKDMTLQEYKTKLKENLDREHSLFAERLNMQRDKCITELNEKVEKAKKESKHVEKRLHEKLGLHHHCMLIDLEENNRKCQQNVSLCWSKCEAELRKHETQFNQLKESHEQHYIQLCEEIKRNAEYRKTCNKEIFDCKVEIYRLQWEESILKLKNLKQCQSTTKANNRENTTKILNKSIRRAEHEKHLSNIQIDTESEFEYEYALNAKKLKSITSCNHKKFLDINSLEDALKRFSQFSNNREIREKEIQAQYMQKCKSQSYYSNILLSDINNDISTTKHEITEEIRKITEAVEDHSKKLDTKYTKNIKSFEEYVRNKDKERIKQKKNRKLNELLCAAQVQLAFLENKRMEQEHLVTAVKFISSSNIQAIKDIECYLYQISHIWCDIKSSCSNLMKHMVATNLHKHRNLKASKPDAIEIKQLEFDQKTATFKGAAKDFFKKCEALNIQFDLTDKKIMTAKENIMKLYKYVHTYSN